MTLRLFITGVTGYIGGDFLSVVIDKHPDWHITCLVRNSDKGAKIATKYAAVQLVYGDLDSVDLIEEQASTADIVYNFADCDHESSAQAIARGLARRNGDNPGFWIHTSGTMILAFESIENNIYGEPTSKIFDDWDGVQELVNMPQQAPHRNVDKIVLDASSMHSNIKTAIVCPPTIYGPGRGPDNQRSMQAYKATEDFLRIGKGFKIGKGTNVWHQVHVHDLSQLYLLLGEAAAVGGAPATWNDQGYYLAENGEFVWGDILQEITQVAHKKGFLSSDKTESVSVEELGKIPGLGSGHRGIGSNSRGTSYRARKLLGWKPKEKMLKDEIPEIVDLEARRLGLSKGHAEKIAEASQ